MELKQGLKIIAKSINIDQAKETIAKCSFFKNFTDEEIDILAKNTESKRFSKNATVFTCNHEGADNQKGSRYFYIIESGSLHLKLKSGKIKKLIQYDCFGEIAVLTEYGRMGTIITTEECNLIAISKSTIFNISKTPLKLALKITKEMARKMVNYLTEDDNQPVGAAYLISLGESKKIEFKEAFHELNKSKIYQTMGAFFNADGGTILIGVRDDKEIIGINETLYTDKDRLKNEITSTINNRFGKYFTLEIDIDFEEIQEKIILRIDCYKAKRPAFFKENGNHRYFVRAEASNLELKGMELYHFLKKQDI